MTSQDSFVIKREWRTLIRPELASDFLRWDSKLEMSTCAIWFRKPWRHWPRASMLQQFRDTSGHDYSVSGRPFVSHFECNGLFSTVNTCHLRWLAERNWST